MSRAKKSSGNKKAIRSLKSIIDTTTSPLAREAALQARAVQRLEMYRRIGYSVVALAALGIYSAVYVAPDTLMLWVSSITLVLFGGASIVLTLGIKGARANIERMLK